MTPFKITNEHLTKIVNLLGEEFNRFDFIYWIKGINHKFKYDPQSTMNRSELNNYFEGKGGNTKVKNIPPLEINNEEQFKRFISYSHGVHREPLIKVFNEDFGIDYWKEVLNLCCEENSHKNHTLNHLVLAHSMNNLEFAEAHVDKLKKLVDKLIFIANKSKNSHFTEVLQYLSFTIIQKDLFGNNWIVESLNNVFSEPSDGSSKQFNFVLDKLSRQFIDLDFSNFHLNTGFKKVLKGKIPLKKTTDCFPYFWQLDIPRYCLANKVVAQILNTNCVSGLEVVDKFLKDQADVLTHFVKREKNMISLSILHEDPKLNAKIDALLQTILDKSANNIVIQPNDFEKSLLFVELNEKMTLSDKKEKKTKI